jgi:hypothetical protein
MRVKNVYVSSIIIDNVTGCDKNIIPNKKEPILFLIRNDILINNKYRENSFFFDSGEYFS